MARNGMVDGDEWEAARLRVADDVRRELTPEAAETSSEST